MQWQNNIYAEDHWTWSLKTLIQWSDQDFTNTDESFNLACLHETVIVLIVIKHFQSPNI